MSFIYALSKKTDETFTINFIGTESLDSALMTGTTSQFELTLNEPISGVTKITSFSQTIDGTINSYQYLKIYYSYKNNHEAPDDDCDNCGWSKMFPIDGVSGITGLTLNPYETFDLKLHYFRVDSPNPNAAPSTIYVSNIVIGGEYDMEKSDEPFVISDSNPEVIFQSKDIYKVFSVDDFEVIYRGDLTDVNIEYRVSQDDGRTWSVWEPLTKENISTYRFNELRFVKMEYLVSQVTFGNPPIKIYDIILIGDFQNISANYLKTNRYGLKEDCLSRYLKDAGLVGKSDFCSRGYATAQNSSLGGQGSNTYDYGRDFYTQGISCYMSNGSTVAAVTASNEGNKSNYWNPYETDQITQFYNMLANQVNDMLAWEVDYHRIDPDKNGEDKFLHEYQLMNVMEVKKLKVIVPDNKFPDNQVQFNTYNLDMFDTFEIHIMKDEFKNKFGIEKRPAEGDYLYFCQINRMFYISHCQIFRDIMNAGIYYKAILEKYEQRANYQNLSEESKAQTELLTKDTTLDELFGIEVQQDMEKIANKDQTYPLTFEKMRESVSNKVVMLDEDLYQGEMKVADSYYDFHNAIGLSAVTYKKVDKVLKVSDNRSFVMWFNFNNKYGLKYSQNEIYQSYFITKKTNFELLNNFNEIETQGYRCWYHNGEIVFQLNDLYFRMGGLSLTTNIWYQLVINMNQRLREFDMFLYRRPADYKILMSKQDGSEATVLSSNTTGYTYAVGLGYRPVTNLEQYMDTVEYKLISNYTDEFIPQSFVIDENIKIMGTDIKYTNLRIFNDVIPIASIGNILNQLIVKDAQHLILADNAFRKLYVPETYPRNEWT